ncbi:MAG: exodeoxyribonuclease V subunit alpha [Succinivibrio sp.]
MNGIRENALRDLPLLGAALCSELSRSHGIGRELMICVMLLCIKLEDGGVCLNLSTNEARSDASRILKDRLDGASGAGCSEFLRVLGLDPRGDPALAIADAFGEDLGFLKDPGFDFRNLAGGAAGGPSDDTPLVWDLGRLYFRRYFNYERAIAQYASSREFSAISDAERARKVLDALFPNGVDDQKRAAALSLMSPFTVISGGPGTGKTTTVTRILMAKLALSRKESPRVMLAAPTGKAAARLSESIALALGSEGGGFFKEFEREFAGGRDLSQFIPRRASTVHSLIGVRPHSDTCRNNEDNKLPCDILVVDEVSMVDMPLFAKLCAALPDECDLVLLGDRDQLCSVEAGAVLADLCAGGDGAEGAMAAGRLIGEEGDPGAFPAPHVALLRKSYRFSAQSGIGNLAKTVNDRSITSAARMRKALGSCLPSGDGECLVGDPGRLVEQALGEGGYGEFFKYMKMVGDRPLKEDEALEALRLMNRFRVLCSNRRGELGTEDVNLRIIRAARSRFGLPHSDWFPGRIVIVTRNNPSAGVSNGDVGFCARGADGGARVWFQGADGGARSVNPVFLPDSEDGFALTVHKSQGSEYECVALCLSPRDNEVLTRELAYTGITRAKKEITMYADMDLLASCCVRSTVRDSALQQRMGLSAGRAGARDLS